MFLKSKKKLTSSQILDLKPGDEHYRAYVGPPRDYDLISAMVFNLLTCIGLRQDHRVLDIGCGSLRVGRLLIPYLSESCYFGVEPNEWLVKDGINNEVGKDLIRLKKPSFSHQASMSDFSQALNIDFAFAQSIFSHCGLDLIEGWLKEIAPHLNDDGVFLATFLTGDEDFDGSGWVYPECVNFRVETISEAAQKYGFGFKLLHWAHPRQQWGVFFKSDFDHTLTLGGDVSWSSAVKARYPNL